MTKCRRLHGRRGLKFAGQTSEVDALYSRRLHGRRGLKSIPFDAFIITPKSPPSRAAWIEMLTTMQRRINGHSRRLHGRRGLKSDYEVSNLGHFRRRLHGRRGLK